MKRKELALHSKDLGFTPREAVRWLAPIALGRTALKVMTATVFADFGDKRELEAGLPGTPLELARLPLPGQAAQPPVERGLGAPVALGLPQDGLWLDFTADLGDGFDATYTVALLLAQEQLTVDGMELKRGNVLVLGGDEVYPVASPGRYEDRMVGPYRTAFPAPAAGGPPPASCPPANILLALPGNHDWYDGLTSFIRVFTRQRSIGSWRTVQNRSYFAVRLSGGADTPGWWLLGLDSQLGQYIDEPQLEYFHRNVSARLVPGDSIILCLASPSWVYSEEPGDRAFQQADFFEQDYLRRRFNPQTGLFEDTGATVRLWLSGDLHHYSRYAEAEPDGGSPVQLVTCGLGGAYLSDTHWLPGEVRLPDPVRERGLSAAAPSAARRQTEPDGSRRFVRAPGSHPTTSTSRQLGLRLANPFSPYWLAARNPGFGPLLGLVHAVFFLAGWVVYSSGRGLPLMGAIDTVGLPRALVFGVVCPLLALGLLVVFWKLFGRTRLLRGRAGLLTMLRGVLYQLAALGAGISLAVLAALIPLPSGLGALLVLGVVYASGWVLGSEAFALYILRTPAGEVASWKMSGQAVEDHKGFLRMRLDPDGSLTVHPLLVETVCRDWDLEDTHDGVRPVPSEGIPAVRLLEQPITIQPTFIQPTGTQAPAIQREGSKP
ncbi:hypothetical protein [Arthrobacter celericrescens]|uniref:hypothetical protein n=1 Tax=Arthrobacter celericrescens TaxID=2320851 RepID=UPI00196961BA|nr:hypothetical protein [Arthrobacter celericrescens]